jgi:hypothetical protein
MNAGFNTSDEYLQMWHSYLDFLRRSLIPFSENLDQDLKTKRESQVEDMRDAFQKAINQLYECNFLRFIFKLKVFFKKQRKI